jgi:L-alanine-DL-glutamate epimerase-like enolase superfamily enzyme
MRVLPIRVRRFRLLAHPVRTRFPFRYGIASMTALPHLFLLADVEIDGQLSCGATAENLPPKWFTKNPDTAFAEDLVDMVAVIRRAGELAVEAGWRESFFALWQSLYGAQSAWAAERGHPPLLAGFGVSLVERAVLDALCRHLGQPVHAVLRENALGVELRAIRPELAGLRPRDALPARPTEVIRARHTVGLGDPLTDDDVETPLGDGLPHTLIENIRAYGLTHFKIKLGGDAAADAARLLRLAELIPAETGGTFHFTLDGNENYPDFSAFRAAWEGFLAEGRLADFLRQGLLFVEQPLHRDHALSDEVREHLAEWRDAPPLIIDEADGALSDLPRALALGYRGTSHKNCKGIVKGLANAALLARQRRLVPQRSWLLSGEDLATIGPLGLLQDLDIMAALGIAHVERNGHHYFRGLAAFPRRTQEQVVAAHPELYRWHPEGFAHLQVVEGCLDVSTVNAACLGLEKPLDLTFADEISAQTDLTFYTHAS